MKTEQDEKAVPNVFLAIFHTSVALTSSAAKLMVLQVTTLHGTRHSHTLVFREVWFKQQLYNFRLFEVQFRSLVR
jgi:hypothetical protein